MTLKSQLDKFAAMVGEADEEWRQWERTQKIMDELEELKREREREREEK